MYKDNMKNIIIIFLMYGISSDSKTFWLLHLYYNLFENSIIIIINLYEAFIPLQAM